MSDLSLLQDSVSVDFDKALLEVSCAVTESFSFLAKSDVSKYLQSYPAHPESYPGHKVDLDSAESVDDLFDMLICDKKLDYSTCSSFVWYFKDQFAVFSRVQLYNDAGLKIYKTGVHAGYMKEQSYEGLDALDTNRKGGAILRFEKCKPPVICQKLRENAEDLVCSKFLV